MMFVRMLHDLILIDGIGKLYHFKKDLVYRVKEKWGKQLIKADAYEIPLLEEEASQ